MKVPVALLACVLVSLGAVRSPPDGGRPERAQATASAPGGPEPFAPSVSSGRRVYRGSFAPDGRTFYFFEQVGSGESYRIVVAHLTGDRWSVPERVDLGGDYSDLYPAITPDGRRMVFSSYRPIPGPAPARPNAHLWYSDLVDGRWGAPVFMARASTRGHYHSWVHVGEDGAVYFRDTTPDWSRKETRVTRWDGREYGTPTVYAEADRWKGWRADVSVEGGLPGPGGQLVFLDVATRNPITGAQASDLWVSMRGAGGWSEPRPIGAGANTPGFDVFPFFDPAGRHLYFVRDFGGFYRIPMAQVVASVRDAVSIRYVANSGVLLEVAGRRFLVDAPIRQGIPPYATSDADEQRRLESAEPPYDRIDAILVTHWHEDHFSADAIAARLAREARTLVVSSPEVVERLRRAAPAVAADRTRAVLPRPGESETIEVAGLAVRVLRLRHNASRRTPEQHLAFLIGDAAPVLHVGDADPVADNFSVLRRLPAPDVAMLPFWYVTDEANRSMVASVIRPRRVVAMHVPPADAPRIRPDLASSPFPIVLADEPGRQLPLSD